MFPILKNLHLKLPKIPQRMPPFWVAPNCLATYTWCHSVQLKCNWWACYIWRDTQNKALSDTQCNVKFSFCFTSKYKAIWKENLVVNQTSLRAFFHAPLHLLFSSSNFFFLIQLWTENAEAWFELPSVFISFKTIETLQGISGNKVNTCTWYVITHSHASYTINFLD